MTTTTTTHVAESCVDQPADHLVRVHGQLLREVAQNARQRNHGEEVQPEDVLVGPVEPGGHVPEGHENEEEVDGLPGDEVVQDAELRLVLLRCVPSLLVGRDCAVGGPGGGGGGGESSGGGVGRDCLAHLAGEALLFGHVAAARVFGFGVVGGIHGIAGKHCGRENGEDND